VSTAVPPCVEQVSVAVHVYFETLQGFHGFLQYSGECRDTTFRFAVIGFFFFKLLNTFHGHIPISFDVIQDITGESSQNFGRLLIK